VRERPDEVLRVARWGSFGEFLEIALFGGPARTSVSMASGTGLLDQETLRWAPAALAAADVEEDRLFPLCDRDEPCQGLLPRWGRRWPALRGVPWYPAVGDGAASNVGSGCVTEDRIALNLGTSAAMRIATTRPGRPPRGLWRYRIDRQTALLGGALSEGGNVHAWCREVLRLGTDEEVDAALGSMPADAHGLTVLPFLAGERAPGWRAGRRGAITGLGLDTTALEIARAMLESVALRLALVYEKLGPLAARDHAIVASGGAAASSRVWPQIVADALGRPVGIAREEEATSRGAAILALGAAGLLRDPAAASDVPVDIVAPDPARHARYRTALARQRELDATLP
jgi:gluconokinase